MILVSEVSPKKNLDFFRQITQPLFLKSYYNIEKLTFVLKIFTACFKNPTNSKLQKKPLIKSHTTKHLVIILTTLNFCN